MVVVVGTCIQMMFHLMGERWVDISLVPSFSQHKSHIVSQHFPSKPPKKIHSDVLWRKTLSWRVPLTWEATVIEVGLWEWEKRDVNFPMWRRHNMNDFNVCRIVRNWRLVSCYVYTCETSAIFFCIIANNHNDLWMLSSSHLAVRSGPGSIVVAVWGRWRDSWRKAE